MKAIIILSVFASMASMILSRQIQVFEVWKRKRLGYCRFHPLQVLPAALGEEESPVADISDLPDETKQVILNYVAEKMDEAFPNLYHEVQTRANRKTFVELYQITFTYLPV